MTVLRLWKDADPDIPILKEAKAEYLKFAVKLILGPNLYRARKIAHHEEWLNRSEWVFEGSRYAFYRVCA